LVHSVINSLFPFRSGFQLQQCPRIFPLLFVSPNNKHIRDTFVHMAALHRCMSVWNKESNNNPTKRRPDVIYTKCTVAMFTCSLHASRQDIKASIQTNKVGRIHSYQSTKSFVRRLIAGCLQRGSGAPTNVQIHLGSAQIYVEAQQHAHPGQFTRSHAIAESSARRDEKVVEELSPE
jgi:hypothetical protein